MQSESDVRKPLLLVLLSLQAAGCAHAKGPYIDCSFHGPAMVAVLASHPLARLQRTGCYGWCPQYAVEVDIDGVVTYVGHEFVMTMGPATGNLSAEQLRSLRKAVALAGHSEMPHERCACGCVADAPDVILTIWERGIPITVTYDDGCARIPAAIHALEAEVERAVGIERWIGTREARQACFEENRDCSSLVGVPEPTP